MHQASSFICISRARNEKTIQKSFKMMKNLKHTYDKYSMGGPFKWCSSKNTSNAILILVTLY